MKKIICLLFFFIFLLKVSAGPFFHRDSAFISGKITGFSGKNGLIQVDDLTGNTTSYLVEPDSAGNFKVCLSLPYPQRNYILFRECGVPFYLQPGEKLDINIIWSESENTWKSISYSGSLMRVNEELLQARKIKFNKTSRTENDFTDSTRMVHYRKIRANYRDYVSGISAWASEKEILPLTRKLLLDEATLHQASELLEADLMLVMNGEPETFTEPAADPAYNFMDEINWNDPELLSVYSVFRFFKLMDYCPILMKKWKLRQDPVLFFKILEKADIPYTAEVQSLKDNWDTGQKQLMADWRQLEYQYSDTLLYDLAQQLVYREIVFKKELNLIPGIIWDILTIRLLNNSLNNTSERKIAIMKYDLLIQDISDASLLVQAQQLLDQNFPLHTSRQKSLVLAAGPAREIFDRLIRPYRGKVILIDVWATWCSPCLAGIERMQPIREKMADRKIAFLFVSSVENSPAESYNRIMQSVQGDKYLLNEDEYNYFCQSFGITTIPHYILVDSNGQIADADFRISELDNVSEQLENLLK